MKLYEYEAADIFAEAGIPVPDRVVVRTADEAIAAAVHLAVPVVVKAQVLAGGRGLAGGVKTAAAPDEARAAAEAILGAPIRGLRVEQVLVSRKMDIAGEFYLGITVDGYAGKPVVVASSAGGVNIEEVAAKTPEKIASFTVDPERGLFAFEARALLKRAGFPSARIGVAADILVRLYRVFVRYEAIIAEINPLAISPDGTFMALDAKLDVDDSAVFRLAKILPKRGVSPDNPLEAKAREIGVS